MQRSGKVRYSNKVSLSSKSKGYLKSLVFLAVTRGFILSEVLLAPSYDQEVRNRDDISTWLAEVLDGSMRTPFEYSFDGQELYARDGSALKPIFKDAIRDAEKIADSSPNLVFELRRRYTEMEEYDDMIAMAKGEAPNTMVVVSDFPPELMDTDQDTGGYNVARKQTMLRVITRNEQGSIEMRSQSLDGSNREALEEIYSELGFVPQAGELLGQRMQFDLETTDQKYLTDRLMGIYDRSLELQYGEPFYAGRSQQDGRNTYDFVCGQYDLLNAYLASSQTDEEKYNLAAAMTARFNQKTPIYIEQKQTVQPYSVAIEMILAGRAAADKGQVFSGCGASLAAKGTEAELEQLGYGNKTSTESSYAFNKKMFCVVCQAPPKEKAPKKMCGPCGICRDCDAKL
jgi:hypothetical protein